MSNISSVFIEKVKQRAADNIVEIIDRRVKLKKAGKSFEACCPFHDEKTPSFKVSPDRGTFKCFGGCGKSGSGQGIDFIMRYERVDFPEAIKMLAAELNMGPVQYDAAGSGPTDHAARSRIMAMKAAMVSAASYYSNELAKNRDVMRYLLSRGINQNDLVDFKLGFAPKGGANLSSNLLGKFSDDVLISASLMAHDETRNRHYDFFYNRVMIPIRNEKGDIIAFGGRTLAGDSKRKYINSAQSDIFAKSNVLYGLYESIAMPGVHQERGIYNVTEGYFDVISAHRVGLTNTVAPMGTAVTEHHIKKLFQRSDKIRFIQDGDKAGIASILSGMKAAAPFLTPTKSCSAVLLPDGEDLDSLLLQPNGFDRVKSLIANELPVSEFIVKYLISVNKDSTEGRAKVVQEVNEIIDRINDQSLKLVMRDTLYKALDLDAGVVTGRKEVSRSPEKLFAALPSSMQKALSVVPENHCRLAGMLVNEPGWQRLIRLDADAMQAMGPPSKGLLELALNSGASAMVEESHPAHGVIRYLSCLAPTETGDQIDVIADFNEELAFHLEQLMSETICHSNGDRELTYQSPSH